MENALECIAYGDVILILIQARLGLLNREYKWLSPADLPWLQLM